MYLITGATGNVGSGVVAELLAKGERVRVLTRDASHAARWANQVEVAIGDFAKPQSFARAVDGCAGVFLMGSGGETPFAPLVNALAAAGVACIVSLSSLLVHETDLAIGRDHKAREEALRAARLPVKFLRPVGFMSNTFAWIDSIKSQGAVYNAMGDGRMAPIAPEDVAAVAATLLTSRSIDGEIFELTGAELSTAQEQVAILARVLKRPLRCIDVSIADAIDGMRRKGFPEGALRGIGDSLIAVRQGRVAKLTDTVERVSGKPPRTFADWAQVNSARFV